MRNKSVDTSLNLAGKEYMNNIEQARFNMIEQQIRPWGVLNLDILDLLKVVKREEYVPPALRELAFFDMEIPLGHDESMLTPKMEARILQELSIKKTDNVLEVGTGSGYLTALLATLAKYVYSVDIVAELSTQAGAKLIAHNIQNVSLQTGNAASGWAQHAPYDVIILTGSVPFLPDEFRQQMAIGGRLFAVVGDSPAMHAQRITRVSAAQWLSQDLFETDIKPLRHAVQPERFVF